MFGMFIVLVIFFATPIGGFLLLGAMAAATFYVQLAGLVLGNPSIIDVVFGGI